MLKEILSLRSTSELPLDLVERLLFYGVLILAAAYIVHFGFLSFLNSPWDFDHMAAYYEIAWRFWKTETFPPGFNPYLQGGRTLGGDPQSFIFSPWTLVAGLVTPLAAVKLQMLTELSIATGGTLLLLNHFKLSRLNKLWGVFLFLSGGLVTSRMATGHVALSYIFFYPLLFWLSLHFQCKGVWKTKAAAWGLILFVYLGNHKPNFFIYGLPPLFLEAILRGLMEKNPRSFFFLVVGTLTAILVNLASLLPSYAYFHHFPRHEGDEWVPIPFYTYIFNLLMPLRTLPGIFYGPRFLQRHEYCLFLGPVVLFLAYKGGGLLRNRLSSIFSSLAFTSLLFVWVGLGATENNWLSPYHLFYKFWPGFHSVRVPPRFWAFSAFALTLFATFAPLPSKSQKGRAFFLTLGVLPLLLSALVNISKPSLEYIPPLLLSERQYPNDPLWQKNDVRYQLASIRAGHGVLHSIENLSFPRYSSIAEKSHLHVLSNTPVKASLRWQDWSRIEFEIESRSSSLVSLNLNAHPYWSLRGAGTLVKNPSTNALTIEVERGSSKGFLEFKQPMAYEGLVASLLSLGLLLLYVLWIFKNTKRGMGRLRIIGLTGGIASGKSTVASLFVSEGIPVIDMDQIGRTLIEEDSTVQNKMKALFGPDIASGKQIDRNKVKEIVFKDPAMKKELEKMLHPKIWEKFYEKATTLHQQGHPVVICEAALLIESKRLDRLDGLIVVMANEATRKKRLMERDKINQELADQILKSQVGDSERKKHATYIIENQEELSHLKEQVKVLIKKLS